MKILFLTFMLLFGAVLGSFSCCQMRRLRAKEQGRPIKNRRSICEHCKKKLAWYENVPIFSWLLLRGRCKKCGEKIGVAEIWAEILMMGLFFALGWRFWPDLEGAFNSGNMAEGWFVIGKIVILAILAVLYLILFLYDALYKVMPTAVLWVAVLVAGGYFALAATQGVEIMSVLAAVGILPGVYFLLYFFSGERLVGSGDWVLALSLALLLGNFWLAFFTLFLANFLATVAYLPSLAKKERNKQIAFGPFLILAGITVFFLQDFLLKLIIF